MKVSLKKAAVLISGLKAIVDKSFESSTSVEIDKFTQNFKSVLDDATNQLVESVDKRMDAVVAMFSIRDMLSKSNHENGVDFLLNQIESKKSTLKVIKSFIGSSQKKLRLSDDEINARLIDLKQKQSSSGYDDSFSVSLFTKEYILKLKDLENFLNRSIIDLKDELLEKNVKGSIYLTEPVINTLKANFLL